MRAKDKATLSWRGWIGLLGAGVMALGCGDTSLPSDDRATVETDSQGSALAAAHSPHAPVPPLGWKPCGADHPGVECAVAQVPLDYDHPHRASTTIALARVPAADRAGRIGSIFVNPGGPGGSGVDLILSGFGEYLAPMLGGRFDVVGFDPRGVAGSEPLICFDSNQELDDFAGQVPLFPYLPAQERPFFNVYRSIAERCLHRHARILPYMSTANVARDLDLLRQAVGDRALSYLGFSYGSLIGSTYANLFPDKIRAVAIDGVLDPRLWTSARQITLDRVASAKEFGEFLRLCDEAPGDCALSGPEGAGARFRALAAALKRAPITLEDGTAYGYDMLINDAASAMYQPESWGGEDGYGAQFAHLADSVQGAPDAARQALAVRKAIQARRDQLSPRREPYDNSAEGYYGALCADAQFPRSFPDWRAVGDYADSGSIFGSIWWWPNAPCADWPVSRDRYDGPWTASTSASVLVVGNYFDGVTDYAGAVATSRLLPNSRLLSYAGWGHTAFGRSGCVTDYTIAYLLEGTLPPEGTVCPANPNPFIPVMAARSLASEPTPALMIGAPPHWLTARR